MPLCNQKYHPKKSWKHGPLIANHCTSHWQLPSATVNGRASGSVWLVQRCKAWLQLRTNLQGHPSSGAPCRIGRRLPEQLSLDFHSAQFCPFHILAGVFPGLEPNMPFSLWVCSQENTHSLTHTSKNCASTERRKKITLFWVNNIVNLFH